MAVGVAAHGADLGSEGAGSAFGKHRGVVVLNRGEQGDDSSRGQGRQQKRQSYSSEDQKRGCPQIKGRFFQFNRLALQARHQNQHGVARNKRYLRHHDREKSCPNAEPAPEHQGR